MGQFVKPTKIGCSQMGEVKITLKSNVGFVQMPPYWAIKSLAGIWNELFRGTGNQEKMTVLLL
jgi:hypothetical protein